MIDQSRIESFIGFGRRDAPVVFIGMEESLKKFLLYVIGYSLLIQQAATSRKWSISLCA